MEELEIFRTFVPEKLKTFKIQEKMKTIYNRIFMLAVALMMSLTSFAQLIDGIYYNLKHDDKRYAEVATSGGEPYSGKITIPSSITYEGVKYPVTGIGNHAFFNSLVTSVTIPNSVTYIGRYAFQYCSKLTSITIPTSVTSIGDGAFENCEGLTSIKIPNSVTSMGDGVFKVCQNLSSVTIGSGLTTLPHETFAQCKALKSIKIPNNITSIGSYSFMDCDNLKNIEFPNTLNTIEAGVFYRCTSITSLTIPNTVKEIGEQTFYGCTKLSSINFSDKLTRINRWTFIYCESLASVTLPKTLTTIDETAFGGCTKLESIIIPNAVTEIAGYAFAGCTGLSSITNLSRIPQVIDESVFNQSTYGDLHVLIGCKKAYQEADVWKNFNVIEDVKITSVMVEDFIDAIGNVEKTSACKEKIDAARSAYDALTKEQQVQVKNINILIEAEKTYKKLIGGSTGITDINSDNDKKDGKYLENGKIVIVKNGKKFNINGLNE